MISFLEGNVLTLPGSWETMILPFSLLMFGLVMNQDRDEAKMAATQNSPPLDLLGEI